MDVNPLAIILVKNGSRGDRLLFRYPYSAEADHQRKVKHKRTSCYAVAENDNTSSYVKQSSSTVDGRADGFSDKATLCRDAVDCYYDLSRRLGAALRHEEYRCNFLSTESKMMIKIQDEVPQKESPFQAILNKSLLAQHLKQVFEDLCSTGVVQVRLNKWIEVSFCLPHKVHGMNGQLKHINHKLLTDGLKKLRAYHSMLLLVDRTELLHSLSFDSSPALRRLIQVTSPRVSFSTLAVDADLTLPQVIMLAGHLVYWGKARIIYPICQSNVYVVSPDLPSVLGRKLVEEFSDQTFGCTLQEALSSFALPVSLMDKCSPLCSPQEERQQVQQVLWLLKHGLLQQLHTFVYLAPPPSPPPSSLRTFGSVGGISSAVHLTNGNIHGPPPVHPTGTSTVYSSSFANQQLGMVGYLRHDFETTNSATSEYLNRVPTRMVHSTSLGTVLEVSAAVRQMDGSAPDSHSSGDSLTRVCEIPQPDSSNTPSESDLGSVCSDDHSSSSGCNNAGATEEYISDQFSTHLTPEERRMVMADEASKSRQDLKLFAKLCPYFHGNHHLEDIMYHANLGRPQLLELLDKFRRVLITCPKPDKSLSLISYKSPEDSCSS